MLKDLSFTDRVRAVVRAIPRGKMMAYGEVAEAAGSPGASRAVGAIMKHTLDPAVPCHRVIRSDGTPGEYNRAGGTKTKVRILKEEGAWR